MADNDQPNRTPDAKERSRQQSRAVSGKEAAKGVSGQPGAGQRSSPKGGAKGPAKGSPGSKGSGAGSAKGPAAGSSGRGGKGGGSGQRPARPGNRPGNRPSGAPRRSSTALLTWGVVGLVLIIVIVLVVVKLTSGSSAPGTAPASTPLPASIAQEVTNIPASVYDTVGISSPTVSVSPPKVLKGKDPLTFAGLPGVLYFGAEYCPYCAAERWAITASLSRFGKFTGLGTMQSSSTDVYPSTQTLTYAKATFTSQYIAARLREYYSNVENSSGTGYELLNPLTKTESKVVDKYDVGKYTGSSTATSHSFPFVDIGNKALVAGASYTPSVLAGLTRAQIAGGLTTTKNPVTRAIIATSNYMSAAVCAATGDKPASVCTSKGVTEAAKALDFKS